MTALAEAFKEAGYETPEQQLRRFAVEAWAKHSKSMPQRQDYVAGKLRGDRTWILLGEIQDKFAREQIQYQAIAALLNRVEKEIKAAWPDRDTGAKTVGGGHMTVDTHAPGAPATSFPDYARPLASHISAPTSRGLSPTTKTSAASPKKPDLKLLADKQQARMKSAVQVAIKLSKLDTVLVFDKKPIGDCTAAEARAWAEARLLDKQHAGRDARFALMMAANLPGGTIIRDVWKNVDEVNALYEKAEAENAA